MVQNRMNRASSTARYWEFSGNGVHVFPFIERLGNTVGKLQLVTERLFQPMPILRSEISEARQRAVFDMLLHNFGHRERRGMSR